MCVRATQNGKAGNFTDGEMKTPRQRDAYGTRLPVIEKNVARRQTMYTLGPCVIHRKTSRSVSDISPSVWNIIDVFISCTGTGLYLARCSLAPGNSTGRSVNMGDVVVAL